MEYTKNLSLEKSTGSEYYDVNVVNENLDKIDKSITNKVTATTINPDWSTNCYYKLFTPTRDYCHIMFIVVPEFEDSPHFYKFGASIFELVLKEGICAIYVTPINQDDPYEFSGANYKGFHAFDIIAGKNISTTSSGQEIGIYTLSEFLPSKITVLENEGFQTFEDGAELSKVTSPTLTTSTIGERVANDGDYYENIGEHIQPLEVCC